MVLKLIQFDFLMKAKLVKLKDKKNYQGTHLPLGLQ